ncbi:hypothetical protein Pcinc_036422 [Petrolisthes cinctipes]|uniref:Secreted protein n=1 Tax=Petrolisthes cinctipes TaxID=88211 RepID=A0AAE1EMK5_PETCI|nr:hypothetical protein Pcinc_036422 [Petrolisthes cinctipes]
MSITLLLGRVFRLMVKLWLAHSGRQGYRCGHPLYTCGRVGVDGRRRRCRSHTSSSRGPSVRDIADVAPPRDITSPVFESLAKIFCVRKYHLSESNVKSPLTNTETRGNTIT